MAGPRKAPIEPAIRKPIRLARNVPPASRTKGGYGVAEQRLPENAEQGFFRDADRDRPAGKLRAAEAGENRDAFDRLSFENALIGRLQFTHEVRRDLLANEILAPNRSRHNGVAAVHDYGDPVGRHLLAAQNFAQSFREDAESQRVARLAVRQYRSLDDNDGLLPDRAYEQVRNDRLSCRDDTPQLFALMKRKLFTDTAAGY